MAKTWVLDTETKGTGAQMVPLEKVLRKEAPQRRRARRSRKPAPRPSAPVPRQPWKFKVVDVMTEQVLAEGIDARAAVDLLQGVRSVVDVSIYIWVENGRRWRALTHREKKALWAFRVRTKGETPEPVP